MSQFDQMNFLSLRGTLRSRSSQHLHRCRLRVTVKDRVHLFHDVGADIQEIPLVLDRDQRAFRAVVLGDLQRFREGAQRLDIALDAHITQDQQSRAHRRFAQRRVCGHEQRHADLCFDAVRQQIDEFDVQIGRVEVAADAELRLLGLQETERPLDGLLRSTRDAPSNLELPRTVRNGDL